MLTWPILPSSAKAREWCIDQGFEFLSCLPRTLAVSREASRISYLISSLSSSFGMYWRKDLRSPADPPSLSPAVRLHPTCFGMQPPCQGCTLSNEDLEALAQRCQEPVASRRPGRNFKWFGGKEMMDLSCSLSWDQPWGKNTPVLVSLPDDCR